MPATYTIAQWAKFLLTGDPASSEPSTTAIEMASAPVIDEAILSNPCIGDDPETELTGADERAFNEWIGRLVALEILDSPAGNSYAGHIIEVTIGPTKEKSQQVSMETACKRQKSMASAARLRISCIREAAAEANRNGNNILDVVGRRRSIGTDGTIEGGLLGNGRCGRI